MSGLSRCRAISFEVFGVLVDDAAAIADGLARHAGVRHPEQVARILDERADAEWELLDELPDFEPWQAVVAKSLVRAAARAGTLLAASAAERIAAEIPEWPLFPDAPDALARLAGTYRLALVTHADRAHVGRLAARLGVSFAHVVTAGDLEAYKPEPDLLLALLHELELDEDELLHVSASVDYDIVTAEDIGVPSAYLDRRGADLPEDVTATLRVADLGQLASRLLAGPQRGARPRSPRQRRT